MLSIWHLLWIVPLAGTLGFMTAALLAVGKTEDYYTGDGK